MFCLSLKITQKRAVFLALVLISVVLVAVSVGFKKESKPKKDVFYCSDSDDVIKYLNSFDIKTGEISVDEITVPFEFGDVYYSYNKIQQSQGFDLSDFKGKTLTRYTAEVKNYPEFDSGVYAEILVYEKEIVGADIYSVSADGFIVALK